METTEYRWLAVRCCCQPTKVLGFLRVTDEQTRYGYLVLPAEPRREEVVRWGDVPKAEVSVGPPIRLAIKRIGGNEQVPGRYVFEDAIYSEDRPIEFWRGVKGFVEAGGPPKSTTHDWDMMKFHEGDRAPGGSDF